MGDGGGRWSVGSRLRTSRVGGGGGGMGVGHLETGWGRVKWEMGVGVGQLEAG